jgi:hypothetical protein
VDDVKPKRVRINIYVPDSAIRRQIKTAAARRDLSVSEYCLRSITMQLSREGERVPRETPRLKAASSPVMRARRFQASAFGGRVFSVSSAELIREDRSRRSANA